MSADRETPVVPSHVTRRDEQPVVPSSAGQDVEIDRYFRELWKRFEQAGERVPHVAEHVFTLAGCPVRLRVAGDPLVSVLTPALAHLPRCTFGDGFDIIAWDGAATGMQLPPPPGPQPESWQADRVYFPFGDSSVRILAQPEIGLVSMFHSASRRGVHWSRDARGLPTYLYGSPLLALLAWWASNEGASLVHGGCVGTDDGALLFVGKGGSGKSTTSLLCAEAGLYYIGDDYCIVRAGPQPTAFSLYSSGKLHREHLAAFPKLQELAVDPRSDQFAKPVMFLRKELGYAMADRLPLRAVVVPFITGRPDTTVEPASAADALRALAPSTLFQLPGEGVESFRIMARLVRALPCFRLNLGTCFETIPPAVRTLLAGLI